MELEKELIEYIIKIIIKYKVNNLLIDNEIIYNFWDDYLCNPFVDSLMAEQRTWDISTRPFFYKDDICYKNFLYLQYISGKYILYPIGKVLVFIITTIKINYLFIANKILNSVIFINLFGPLRIIHFEMILRIWFFFSSIAIIFLFLLYIYIVYLLFQYVKNRSKEIFLDLFDLCLDWNQLLYHYILILIFLVFNICFLCVMLPFQNYPKLRKIYFFFLKACFVLIFIVPLYIYIYLYILNS